MKRRFLISGLLMAAVMFTAAAADPQYISPNNDGVQDELVIPLKVSDKRYVQGWSLVITDANGAYLIEQFQFLDFRLRRRHM